jgi:hypothetical protein
VDRKGRTVRSSRGELRLDLGEGVSTIDAPSVQDASGNLRRAGVDDRASAIAEPANIAPPSPLIQLGRSIDRFARQSSVLPPRRSLPPAESFAPGSCVTSSQGYTMLQFCAGILPAPGIPGHSSPPMELIAQELVALVWIALR